MAKHESGLICTLCEEKLKGGHPYLRHCFQLIRIEFPTCHTSWVFRGKADQDSFYLMGKTHEKWPYSKHNHMEDDKPCSLAIDLFQLSKENRAIFSPRFYYEVNSFCEINDLELEWSGNWKFFREFDHFQMKDTDNEKEKKA